MVNFFIKDNKEFKMNKIELAQMKNNKKIVEQICKSNQQKIFIRKDQYESN